MEGKKLLDLLIEELSSECYYEPVRDDVRESVGLKKEDVFLPMIATGGSAGADFFAPFTFDLGPGEEIRVPTGIKAHCHRYTRLSIVPKSGLGFKYYTRLANTIGIIDEDYYGNSQNDGCIFVKIRNEGNKSLHIERGEAFCQGIFELYIPDRDFFTQAHELRDGGFGSTNAKV
ncbi:MAG: deoxyuridine 5'-triphosphate nucleotidohydrolase [Firmicutes bacterium]|nr:deoxyuridine 5'-triphosphate nucleotidohydrolase [Bacillota bacterium]